MKKLSNIQNINMNKASMLLHFILLLMLTIGGLQQMLRINDYKWVTILYDLINFCTTMVIAYIVYVANGGRKRKKTENNRSRCISRRRAEPMKRSDASLPLAPT